jgi:hypothetical protein
VSAEEWERWRDVPADAVPLVVFELASVAIRRARAEVEEAVASLERARVRFEEMQTRHRRKIAVLARWIDLADEAARAATRFAEARATERRRLEWEASERARFEEAT